jgi:hypothetical protein
MQFHPVLREDCQLTLLGSLRWQESHPTNRSGDPCVGQKSFFKKCKGERSEAISSLSRDEVEILRLRLTGLFTMTLSGRVKIKKTPARPNVRTGIPFH